MCVIPQKSFCYSVSPACSLSPTPCIFWRQCLISVLTRHRVAALGIAQTQTQKMGVVSGYPRVLTSSADFASEDLRCRMGTLTADWTALSVEGPTDLSLSLTARTSSCLRYRKLAVTKGWVWLDLVTQVCNPRDSALQKARQDSRMIKTCLGYRGVSSQPGQLSATLSQNTK